tara:strand:+ start:148 stop:402 length:255 start_codon:yes stop_codon:yes gene_type:complete
VKSFPTSQGCKVYYFITSSDKSFLIPQMIEKFVEFKKILKIKIEFFDFDLDYISPLWTYKFLTIISILIFIGEFYTFFINKYLI